MTVYADLYRFRELFANLFRRDFHAKYKGSLLGIVWSLLNPLLLLAVYLVVFGVLFPNAKTPHYPIYLLGGLACWLFFSVSLQSAARSMIDSGELIKKVRFPRQLVRILDRRDPGGHVRRDDRDPARALASRSSRRRGRTAWAAIPLAVVFLGLVAGLSLLVACLNVLLRDVEHILTAALLPWFFLTPILWRVGSLPDRAQQHHKLLDVLRWGNPLAPPIFAIRDALWSGHLPRIADVVYLCVAAALALALGAFVFRRVDDRIALEL